MVLEKEAFKIQPLNIESGRKLISLLIEVLVSMPIIGKIIINLNILIIYK